MGSAINRSLINAHFSISAYFLTVQTYKCMHLTTQVWISDKVNVSSGTPAGHLWIDISVSADAGCQAIPQWHLHAAGCRHLTPVCAHTSDCTRHFLVNSRELISLLLLYLRVACAISHQNRIDHRSRKSRLLELGRRHHHSCGCCVSIH